MGGSLPGRTTLGQLLGSQKAPAGVHWATPDLLHFRLSLGRRKSTSVSSPWERGVERPGPPPPPLPLPGSGLASGACSACARNAS